ncbi:hypothetical protein L2E82_37336 [Cichorium intybus]|uniref:Uncharacterized protein n=1 Tax=Cichorium intybus TaxID=13427 RepID=A0ACB9AEN8_CICIN|nr:hypothetical protein L2E82_37336 [Cichorium intybus]
MASPVAAEEHSYTKSEEGTTVFHKKRSRRVSFAENTSVHIFDRDEEIETPPDPDAPSSPHIDLGFSDRDGEPKQFFGNEEEDNEDEDMDDLGPKSPFFRVVRSPSSGGSTIGSATSNDEDNFFGPVSAKFIRRDLSDSATSDGNHDQTMDSTSFSMHFNSIARSDSETDLKTSTGVHLSFEEKTPTSSMLLTLDKKPNSQPDVSTSKFNTGSQSNDMSLVGEYHNKYDYGKLSPALLSEDHDDLHVVSHIPVKTGKQSSAKKENGCHLMDSKTLSPNCSHKDTLTVKTNKPIKDASDKDINSSLKFLAAIQDSQISKNILYQSDDVIMEKENKSPFADMSYHMLLNSGSLLKSPGTLTPSTFFLTTESQKHGGSFSVSSLQKSISKLKILEASPFSASLNAKLKDSNAKSPVNKELYSVLQNHNIDPLENLQSVNQFLNQDVSVTSATKKRKTEDMMNEKIARIKSSSRFFKETKLLPHSVDKMNLHAIDCMIDILDQLHRSKTYELFSNEIKSQVGINIQEKRVTETRLLLCKIVHEKAKLQLMQVKQEKLLENLQSLASGIQESEALKLNYSLHNQVIHHQPKNIQECEVEQEKVTLLKESIKATDGKISNFIESFHVSYKMKEEAGPTDTIAFVKNHLMKRARCQIIGKDLQLWVIEDLKSNKDHHHLVLNYLDLMTQRFTLTPGVVTSISVSNILNETNILKNFKDINALTAFKFVLNTASTQKPVADTNLAHETQMTSSLLGNLVDVMEEIQRARIELKNLINARTALSGALLLGFNYPKKGNSNCRHFMFKKGYLPVRDSFMPN